MDALFKNLRSIEQVKADLRTSAISIYPCRRCEINPVTKEKIPGKYVYMKHASGTQKYFAVDDSQTTYLAVAEALAKDLETTGAPDPNKVVVCQEVSQDNGVTWIPQLMYQGGNQDATFKF